MKKIINICCCAALLAGGLTSCNSFLDDQVPQASLLDDEVQKPTNAEAMVVSAYAIFSTAEDINASFSMWNFDVRSDDAYKGGNGTGDGGVFHQLEVEQGVLTTNWNISDMWERLYKSLSRVNASLALLNKLDDSFALKQQRIAEMKFLRAYGHFLLKRLYKNIPFVNDENLSAEQYTLLNNRQYTNDEGWQQIINDAKAAFDVLPETQADKGRPTKAAAAALLTKLYLYKAYRQDDANSNQVTSINQDDLQKVIDYSDPKYYPNNGLEADIHNNFRPEERYENGIESIWAIQYSRNDGSTYGNLNWGNGLIAPNIAKTTDGGCDFYKPTQNLVNAFRTDASGLPLLDTFNDKNWVKSENCDPRLFLTVGMPGFPYMFNKNFMMDESENWSRSKGTYGYYVTVKQNVDPALIGEYLIKGSFWATSMNRIVFRYADVLLERAEAYAQMGNTTEAIKLVNDIRNRAANSTQMISTYPADYGVSFNCKTYTGSYSKDDAIKIVKMERRLELAMESERFFDLVRWGEAESVINKYFAKECTFRDYLKGAGFTANKDEYLPIPFEQMSASNGHYTQNIGGW